MLISKPEIMKQTNKARKNIMETAVLIWFSIFLKKNKNKCVEVKYDIFKVKLNIFSLSYSLSYVMFKADRHFGDKFINMIF